MNREIDYRDSFSWISNVKYITPLEINVSQNVFLKVYLRLDVFWPWGKWLSTCFLQTISDDSYQFEHLFSTEKQDATRIKLWFNYTSYS